MKPCNYKGWLPDVNLISRQTALRIHPPPYPNHRRIRAAYYRPHLPFDTGVICFISKNIG